jgi:predicted RNA-binding protein YlqC (UPF0109 family)
MWIEGPTMGSDFRHPFLVTATASVARVSSGLILAEAGIEPVIGGKPLVDGPTLKLSSSLVNSQQESWVCVEVTPDSEGKVVGADGKLVDGALVEVVQSASPFASNGAKGRAPLAMLFYGAGTTPQVVQIAMFHLRYETNQPAEGPRRHYFL